MVTSSHDVQGAPMESGDREILRGFQAIGLRPYEIQVLLALFRLGTATSATLAQFSGVPRTSIYQVMEGLTARGLADRIPSHGSTTWLCDGWMVVLDRLDATRQDEHRRHQALTAGLRASLAGYLHASPEPG